MKRKASLFRRGTVEEKLYHVWYNMRDRCYNPTHPAYSRYGKRGITVVEEWRDFRNFLDWAKSGYKEGLWLDRKDNDGEYSPTNCRWVTPNESRDNVRGTMYITAFGETKSAAEWTRDSRCVVKRDTLRQRIKYGYEPELAITTPVGAIQWLSNQPKNKN